MNDNMAKTAIKPNPRVVARNIVSLATNERPVVGQRQQLELFNDYSVSIPVMEGSRKPILWSIFNSCSCLSNSSTEVQLSNMLSVAIGSLSSDSDIRQFAKEFVSFLHERGEAEPEKLVRKLLGSAIEFNLRNGLLYIKWHIAFSDETLSQKEGAINKLLLRLRWGKGEADRWIGKDLVYFKRG